MNTALCDPNYKPRELYRQIEGLLLFYEQVLLYAPSQDQIQRAGLDWQRLERLIIGGFVVPVGREFWFDPKERDKLTKHFADNPEKSATYRWSELDETILKLGPLSSLPSGSSQALLAGVSFGLFGSFLPNVATPAVADLVDPRFHTLFVLIRQQQARTNKRSGK